MTEIIPVNKNIDVVKKYLAWPDFIITILNFCSKSKMCMLRKYKGSITEMLNFRSGVLTIGNSRVDIKTASVVRKRRREKDK